LRALTRLVFSHTAARIETTGHRGRIHLSEQTAAELIAHGKVDWLVRRDDLVEAKGKGKLATYWLKHALGTRAAGGKSLASTSLSFHDSDDSETETTPVITDTADFESNSGESQQQRKDLSNPLKRSLKSEERIQRLVEWNCELLMQLLKQVVTRRMAVEGGTGMGEKLDSLSRMIGVGSIVADEVAEIIEVPDYIHVSTAVTAELPRAVKQQLKDFVSLIASMYNDNPCKYRETKHGYSPYCVASLPSDKSCCVFFAQSTISSMPHMLRCP
jgi:Adenylate and Guanylate cyclase catalytic domain